jgi:hypothetical protein
MALIYLEGFDNCTSAQLSDKDWVINTSFGGTGSSYARFSGQGYRITHDFGKAIFNIGVDKSTIYLGIAIRKHTVSVPSSSSTEFIVGFYDENEVQQVRINVTPAYEIQVYKGDNTLLGTSDTFVFPNYAWCYLEAKVTISATVGEVTVNIDGDQVLNLTTKDTKNGTDYIRKIGLRAVFNGRETYFDDLYIDDAQFHGDCRVQTFMPDSDSATHTDFVRSTGSNDYECVYEAQSNEDTDYIESSTLNHKSTFGITTGTLPTVIGAKVSNHCKVSDAGTVKIKALCRSNGTTYQGTESSALSADYLFKSEIWEDDPDDSNPWDQTKLEAAEFGVEISTI